MMKYLLIFLFLGCVGCAHYRPDTFYTEQATYDDHSWYQEYGVSGKVSDRVRVDFFVSPRWNVSDHTDEKIKFDNFGGGFRISIGLGDRVPFIR